MLLNYFDTSRLERTQFDSKRLHSVAVSPSLTTKPINETVLEMDIATFFCSATGNPTPKITWIKDGKTVGTGDIMSFMASRNYSGEYWCSADNGLSEAVTGSAYLDVQCKYNISLVLFEN